MAGRRARGRGLQRRRRRVPRPIPAPAGGRARPGGGAPGGGGLHLPPQDGHGVRFHDHRRGPPGGAPADQDDTEGQCGRQGRPSASGGRDRVHKRDIRAHVQSPQGGGPLQEHPHGVQRHPGGEEGLPAAGVPGRQAAPLHGVVQSELPPPSPRRRAPRGDDDGAEVRVGEHDVPAGGGG